MAVQECKGWGCKGSMPGFYVQDSIGRTGGKGAYLYNVLYREPRKYFIYIFVDLDYNLELEVPF
jgi:hypothetical protein